MQQAAVLHPDAARHTHTVIQFLLSGCDNGNASWTKKEICVHIAAPHPNLRPPPPQFTNLKTPAKIETTWAPGLPLPYAVCVSVCLSLSLSRLTLPLSLFFSPSLSVSLLLAGWIPAVIHAQPLPQGPRPITSGSIEGRPTSTNLISIAEAEAEGGLGCCRFLKRQLARFPVAAATTLHLVLSLSHVSRDSPRRFPPF